MLTAQQYAETVSKKWKPMSHQVALRLANQGRIPGAIPHGEGRRKTWEFPEPENDPRKPRGKPRKMMTH